MDTLELEVVKGGSVEVVEQIDDEFEVVEPIEADESDSEPDELSIEELEDIFADLN
jgi:hypothetical protein